jgi:class 3 adenylate cyclase
MALPRLIPALADLTQDIAGPLPLELFRDWATGNQDAAKASAMLRPFEVFGTVVATDTSGLSRMTEERDLLDVLAMVSQPKEIVHALGAGVGGRAIGTWVADNTEMHYPPGTPIESVVAAMVEAQARIAAEAQVKIGMCVHEGAFYEIGGGLYGHDADTVEYIAERFAAPGEILLTQPVVDRLPGTIARTDRRRELDVVYAPGVYTLTSGPRLTAVNADQIAYPHPFPDEFFRALLALRTADAPAELRAELYRSLLHDRTIVFISRERDAVEDASITALLDNLVANAVMEAVLHRSAARDHVASLGGGLAILCFEDQQEAVEAALAIRDAFVESALPVKIGVDAGPVLLFAKPRGPSGISGDAVNIASKISEDLGIVNTVSVTARVAKALRGLNGAVPFQATISRIAISGIRL